MCLRLRETDAVRWIGAVRLPLALTVRPWADLYTGPERSLFWTVRLWAEGRAEPRVLSTDALRCFARANRLDRLRREIDVLVARAGAEERR